MKMRSLNKKLYAVILVCLMVLSFGIVAIAEEGTPTNPDNSNVNTVAPSNPSDSEGNNSEGAGDTTTLPTTPSEIVPADDSSTNNSELVSSVVSSSTSNSSNTNTSGSSTSSKASSSKKQTSSSKKQTTTDNNNYQKPSGYGNVGGTVDDGIDTSGWGAEDASSELQSAGTTEKTGSKQITNYSTILWILIWIPILLIIASVAALVYVNRKEFLDGENNDLSDDDDITFSKKKTKKKTVSKSKASHKKRTNVYKPRD